MQLLLIDTVLQVTPHNPASVLSPKSLQLAPEDLLADDLFAAMQVALLPPDRSLSLKPFAAGYPAQPSIAALAQVDAASARGRHLREPPAVGQH